METLQIEPKFNWSCTLVPVSKGFTLMLSPEADETAHFVDMMNKFFDAVNVCNFDEAKKAI